ncbi:MAG: ROK family protein [Acidimicrobiales bacterium]|nr:ROK family protein [Acidimicrobiales bacterium]
MNGDDAQIACVEVGGSGVETVLFAADGTVVRVDGALRPADTRLAIATPGNIEDGRVVAASNLGWLDVDPTEVLGIGPAAELVLNDAEAAALGEVVLREGVTDAVYICIGTGVGGAVVRDGQAVATNLLGHLDGYSERECVCGQMGCLETVAAGWALPDPIDAGALERMASSIAHALQRETLATPRLVVLGGGIARRYPALRAQLAEHAADRSIELSAAPAGFKSASAWGLRAALATPSQIRAPQSR